MICRRKWQYGEPPEVSISSFYIYIVNFPLDCILTYALFHVIMCFVTIWVVTEADGVPVAARSRSSGSKRRNTGEKITEDKSEKVIRWQH